MDKGSLEELEAALAAAPGNVALRLVIARGWLAHGDAARALAALEPGGDAPEVLRLRATALLGVGRADDARSAYRRAVAASPAVEDLAFEAEVEAAAGQLATRELGDDNVLRLVAGGMRKSQDDGDRAVAPAQPRVTFAQVGGLDDVKDQVRKRVILPFLKPSLFERFRRKVTGGILMYGPPGCGKTLMARAVAGECDAKFYNVSISDVLDMYIGESEAKLHALFQKARATAPSVLFFDEIEALGAKRSGHHDQSGARLVSQFLSEMDGYAQANAGVLVLGATNLPWAVDAAFRRPGRFDRFVLVPPPDRAAREAILRIHLRDRPGEKDLDVPAIAKRTSGYSGADLEGLVDAASDAAIEDTLAASSEVPLSMKHLERALKEVKPTTLEWLTTARNHARYANEGGQYDDVLAFLDRHGER